MGDNNSNFVNLISTSSSLNPSLLFRGCYCFCCRRTVIIVGIIIATFIGSSHPASSAYSQSSHNNNAAALGSADQQNPMANSIFAEDYQVSFEIGRSVDLFNRFGFLQLSFKVLPGVYAGKPEYILIEKSFPVFTPQSRVIQLYKAKPSTGAGEAPRILYKVTACDSVIELLAAYFINFSIEGLTESWKAFVPDFKKAKLSRSFGIDEKILKLDHKFLLIKVELQRYSGVLDGELQVSEALLEKVQRWRPESQYDCLNGVGKVGSHVIQNIIVGDVIFQVIAYDDSNFAYVQEALGRGNRTLVLPSLDPLKHLLTPNYAADFGRVMLVSGDRATLSLVRDQLREYNIQTGEAPSLAKLATNPKAVAAISRSVGHVIIGAQFSALIKYVPKSLGTEFCKRILFNALQLYEANIM